MTRPEGSGRPGGLSVRLGTLFVLAVALAALAAPVLAPYSPHETFDASAGRQLPPGSERTAVRLTDGRWRLGERVRPTAEGVEVERLGAREVWPAGEVAEIRPLRFRLGTDHLGRDVLSRLLWGARVSLGVGLLATLAALTLGLAIGGLAGMAGGAVDALLMAVVQGLLTFPRLFLVIAVAALFENTWWTVVLMLGATGWMTTSRLVRGEIRKLRSLDYVVAARGLGQHPVGVFLRHLLPNALAPVLVDVTLRVGGLVLAEAALSFLGLGIRPPTASWGNMIADGRDSLVSAWWMTVFPGAALSLTVIAFNLLGDGLRDRLDPRRAGVAG